MNFYAQITERCNLTCAHCCFSCTSKGEDMTHKVFARILDLVKQADGMLTIGGGEPTLHKDFIPWTLDAAVALDDISENLGGPAVYVVTNGTVEKKALILAKMIKGGIVSGRMSWDKWHPRNKVSPKVVKAFGLEWGQINPLSVVDAGRAIENQLYEREDCCCDAIFISPDGTTYQCGCRKTIMGNIFDLSLDDFRKLENEDGEIPCEKSVQKA